MGRRKLTPQERLMATLRRSAYERPWPGLDAVLSVYPSEPEGDEWWKEMSRLMAAMSWNSWRPSAKVIELIVGVLTHWPQVTMDGKGRRLTAALWLDLVLGITPEQLQSMIAGTFEPETPAQAEAEILRRLAAMVEALEPEA
jgi:hypothetical protein